MFSDLNSIQEYTIKALSRHLNPGDSVALVDFPRHMNSGDSLIWVGANRYLEKIGVKVNYISSLHYFNESEFRRIHPAGPILINGGGNFGDRWKGQQDFRELVIRTFPDRKIIQLPQSLDFRDKDNLTRSAELMAKHGNIVLLVRELQGIAGTQALFPNVKVEFCPDLALGVGQMRQLKAARRKVVALLRQDNEASRGVDPELDEQDIVTYDWHWETKIPSYLYWRLLRLPEDVSRVVPFLGYYTYGIRSRAFSAMAKENVRSATLNLCRGDIVVTDRLHAMVLSLLLGKKVLYIDNDNKKVSRIFSDYVRFIGDVTMVKDVSDAYRMVNL